MSSARTDARLVEFYSATDQLGRRPLAVRIAEDAIYKPGGILGVFGGWGMGKTHLLQLIGQQILDDTNRPGVARLAVFHAWRYENESLGLGAAMLRSLAHQDAYPKFDSLGEKGRRLESLSVIQEVLQELLPAIAWAFVPGGKAKAIEKLVSQQLTNHSLVDTFDKAFNKIVEAALAFGDEARRLVILIDDLDRCSPESMVTMFEWMKVHLRHPKCTFVVALDHRAAAHAIEGRYRQYLPPEGKSGQKSGRHIAFGYRYLEKLFDNEFELSRSIYLESMVVRRVFNFENLKKQEFGRATAHYLGRDFPYMDWMSDMVSMPCLQAARTLLRIGYTYQMVLEAYQRHRSDDQRRGPAEQFPPNVPFWLLLLVCMQHAFRPEELDAFVNHQGHVYQSLHSGRMTPEVTNAQPENPLRQFADFLVQKHHAGLRTPPRELLQALLNLVRQRVFLRSLDLGQDPSADQTIPAGPTA